MKSAALTQGNVSLNQELVETRDRHEAELKMLKPERDSALSAVQQIAESNQRYRRLCGNTDKFHLYCSGFDTCPIHIYALHTDSEHRILALQSNLEMPWHNNRNCIHRNHAGTISSEMDKEISEMINSKIPNKLVQLVGVILM